MAVNHVVMTLCSLPKSTVSFNPRDLYTV